MTTKSKLFFVPSHHHFEEDGMEITKEMIEWPIMNSEGPINEEMHKIYKDAFFALLQISPFHSKVSMEVDMKNKCFKFPKRTWGVIYLRAGGRVVSFSHDTRSNGAFNSISDWPEIGDLKSFLPVKGEDTELTNLNNGPR